MCSYLRFNSPKQATFSSEIQYWSGSKKEALIDWSSLTVLLVKILGSKKMEIFGAWHPSRVVEMLWTQWVFSESSKAL